FVSAEEVYSSMVSDLRQTCPIDRMCRTLANATTFALYRYVVTATPSTSSIATEIDCEGVLRYKKYIYKSERKHWRKPCYDSPSPVNGILVTEPCFL
ncbi:hypothetical protein TNIN_98691, partial [Trichonephila inaurata madagascariensis]